MRAIVLKRRDWRESDQIISLYTKEKGKVDAIARGVKKITSKNSAHLEPFSLVEAELTGGRELPILTTAVPHNFFSAIRVDLGKSLAAWYSVNLIDLIVHVNEPDLRLWQCVASWLNFVNDADQFVPILVDGFVIKFFSLLGFTPVFSNCVACGKSYAEIIREELTGGGSATSPGFYFRGGGLVCAVCREAKMRVGEQVFVGGIRDISNLQVLLHNDWQTIFDWSIESREEARLHTLVFEFAEYHSERKLTDWRKFSELNG